jgi:hypothetical protein
MHLIVMLLSSIVISIVVGSSHSIVASGSHRICMIPKLSRGTVSIFVGSIASNAAMVIDVRGSAITAFP